MRHILWIGLNSVDADARYAVMLPAGERLAKAQEFEQVCAESYRMERTPGKRDTWLKSRGTLDACLKNYYDAVRSFRNPG
jgi:hypothetical protein